MGGRAGPAGAGGRVITPTELRELAERSAREREAKAARDRDEQDAAEQQRLALAAARVLTLFREEAERVARRGGTRVRVMWVDSFEYSGPIGPYYQTNPALLKGVPAHVYRQLAREGFTVRLTVESTREDGYDVVYSHQLFMEASW